VVSLAGGVKTAKVVMVSNNSRIRDQIQSEWRKSEASESPPWKYSQNQVEFVHHCEFQLDGLHQLKPELVLLVTDEPCPEFEKRVLEKCREMQVCVRSVLGRGTVVLMGPLEIPNVAGCTTCMQLRWEYSIGRVQMNAQLNSAFCNSRTGIGNVRVPLVLTDFELQPLAELVVQEIRNNCAMLVENMVGATAAADVGPAEQRLPQIALYRRNRLIEWVSLVPHHDCPRCNVKMTDHPGFGSIQFDSCLVEDVRSLRVKSLDFEYLKQLYVHEEVGYISKVHELWSQPQSQEPYVRTSARISLPDGTRYVGYGSGGALPHAMQSAVLEVVERSCAAQATNRRPVVWGTYLDYKDVALNPRELGLHDDAFYHQRSGLEPFDEDNEYSFVWAYSHRQNRPILIPEQIAHYGKTRDEQRFVLESSNGCALGGMFEEAVLHAIFEVLERDGFLNMWYGKLPVPELLLGPNCPADVVANFRMLENKGYDVRLLNVAHEIGIPAIVAVAVGPAGHFPRAVAGSSCHLNPYEATRGALRELTVQVLHLEGLPQKRIAHAREMAGDKSKIHDIADHVLAAGVPEAFANWGFLLGARRGRTDRLQGCAAAASRQDWSEQVTEQTPAQTPDQTVEEAFGGVSARYGLDTRDIRIILHAVLADLQRLDFDVIVVKQTNIEAAAGGLHVAKVVIPGMTPITFGHGSRRVQGLTRVVELPYRLGYTARVLRTDELNENCHPFS